jgi:hypothetical protein
MDHLSTAETAALMRKALKTAFPNVKFSVVSKVYTGGSSINVSYQGIDHWDAISACHCPTGPTITKWPDRCDKCGFFDHETPVYKPGMPTKADVKKVVGGFEGKGFDGMIDMSYYIEAYVDEAGNIVGTKSRGTEGSRGLVPAWDDAPAGAHLVSFSSSYVYVNAE